jgi:hypothetical protein
MAAMSAPVFFGVKLREAGSAALIMTMVGAGAGAAAAVIS